MTGKYKVITLCGSTRFRDAFLQQQQRLTLKGNIVLSPVVFGSCSDDALRTESTRSEIEYAQKTGKTVRYLEEN
jgi:hypothetical protein